MSAAHRDLCRSAARWLVSAHGRNLFAAAYEIAVDGGVADALGISCPDPAADVAFRAREYQALRAVAAAKMARRVSRKGTLRDAQREAPLFAPIVGDAPVQTRHLRAVERHGAPVIAVVECKASRADLLADLREQKLRRYERAASECWLYAPAEVFASGRGRVSRPSWEAMSQEAQDQLLSDLRDDGLPESWGVLLHRERIPSVIRRPVRREVEPWEVVGWSGRIAASYSHRALGTGPMASEMAG